MDPRKPLETPLKSGYFFSPGFYLSYWKECIIANFDPETVAFNGALKQHREVWVGAHLAALKTKLSGSQFFVGLPDSDPPDVLVGDFTKTKLPSGRIGNKLNWYPVEITRCDEGSGENLFDQIQKKNKFAYKNTVLVVYLQGAQRLPDLHKLAKALQAVEVHPHEIIVMAQVRLSSDAAGIETFGFARVYPGYDSAVISREDEEAFFREPNVMKVTGLGVQDSAVTLGFIKLMKPSVKA